MRMDALPLNSNGKLDRAALPTPSQEQAQGEAVYHAPQSPLEQQVAAIASELLQLERVSLDDNFFLLGGHSLLGTQLVLRVRERFGCGSDAAPSVSKPKPCPSWPPRSSGLIIAKLDSMPEDEAGRLLAILEGEASEDEHAGKLFGLQA